MAKSKQNIKRRKKNKKKKGYPTPAKEPTYESWDKKGGYSKTDSGSNNLYFNKRHRLIKTVFTDGKVKYED